MSHLAEVGDRGQRYEVVQIYHDGVKVTSRVWGWTNEQDGGALADAVAEHPETLEVRVVDRTG